MASVYAWEMLITGFPGKSTTHGGLGWSSVTLLRSDRHVVLVDTGGPGMREPLAAALARHGLAHADVTDVAITHCHWDHLSNYTLFPAARILVPAADLAWAARQPPGTWHVPELHVARLAAGADRTLLVAEGDRPLPGCVVVATPGHTPGHVAYVWETDGGAPLICAGDAVKNRVELVRGEVDMSLDADASRHSIARLRAMLQADERAVMVLGHDACVRWRDGAPDALWEPVAALARIDAQGTYQPLPIGADGGR